MFEVYVTKALLFQGSVFGQVVNNQTILAKLVVGVMVEWLHGGPVFLSKMLPPVTKLDAEFMLEEISKTIDANLW